MPTERRGALTLGRLTLQSDWPLGLWTCWTYLHTPAQGLVYPAPENDPPPIPSTANRQDGDRAEPATQGDVFGLRDYVEGDSLNAIAWKSAARGLGLQVRTFETNNGPSEALLALSRTGTSALEAQLSRLCAWVLNAESAHTDYALHLPNETLDAGHGRTQKRRALQALALFGQNNSDQLGSQQRDRLKGHQEKQRGALR